MKRIFSLFFLLLALTVEAQNSYHGSFTGNASGLTNLTAGGVFSGANLMPNTGVYTNNALAGSVTFGVHLTAGVVYNYFADPNCYGIYSGDGGTLYPPSFGAPGPAWSGNFTVPTNGNYVFLSLTGSAGDTFSSQLYVSDTVTIPVDLAVQGNFSVQGNPTFGTPLPVLSGGTGSTSLSGLASQVGTEYLGTASPIKPVLQTNTAAYAGQVITANEGGANQPTQVVVAAGTGAGQNTNVIDLRSGVAYMGYPFGSSQSPGTFVIYSAGNAQDQTNGGDFGMGFFFNMAYKSSGSLFNFPWLGTNATYGNSVIFPNTATTVVTNASGEKIYCHDKVANGFGTVEDGSVPSNLPNTALWVVNGGANYGTGNISLHPVIAVNGPVNGLTAGNYTIFTYDPPSGMSGGAVFKDSAWKPSSNNWVWGWSFNHITGAFNVASNLNVGTLTATNGIGSTATNTYSMTSTGYTNSGTKNIQVLQFFCTSGKYSNALSHTSFTLGNLTNTYVLKPNCSLTGTACTAVGIEDQ